MAAVAIAASRNSQTSKSTFLSALRRRPYSDLTKIVFYWENEDFSKSELNPIMLENRATEYDIDRVLDNLRESPYYSPNKREPCLWTLLGLFSILIFFVPISIPTLVDLVNKYKISDDELKFGMIGVFVSYFVIIMVIAINISRRKIKHQKARKEDFEERLRKFNDAEFRRKGLSWSVGDLGAWIQLNLDYMIAGIQGGIAAGNPVTAGLMPTNYAPMQAPGMGGVNQGASFDTYMNANNGQAYNAKQVPLLP